jgi:hypothetical protein
VSTAPRRSLLLLAALSAIVVIAVCALHTRATYLEYYGDGPPYYGRTTNMDKWQSPMTELVVSNALGLAWLAAIAFWMRRRAGSR